jgi:hypothetical protein
VLSVRISRQPTGGPSSVPVHLPSHDKPSEIRPRGAEDLEAHAEPGVQGSPTWSGYKTTRPVPLLSSSIAATFATGAVQEHQAVVGGRGLRSPSLPYRCFDLGSGARDVGSRPRVRIRDSLTLGVVSHRRNCSSEQGRCRHPPHTVDVGGHLFIYTGGIS